MRESFLLLSVAQESVDRTEGGQGAHRECEMARGDIRLAGVDPDQRAIVSMHEILAGHPDRRHGLAGPDLDDGQARGATRSSDGLGHRIVRNPSPNPQT